MVPRLSLFLFVISGEISSWFPYVTLAGPSFIAGSAGSSLLILFLDLICFGSYVYWPTLFPDLP